MAQLGPVWKKRLAGGAILLTSGVLVVLLVHRPDWTGFGPDSTRTTERDSTGKLIKTVVVDQSGKTLWDWLSLLGVPLSLAGLGFYFQQQQQRRSEEQARIDKDRAEQQAKLEREIAENNQQEEVLQTYFDRVSALLVDKNLLALAAKDGTSEGGWASASIEEKELLDASVDVIRARTLSILRRLEGSGERKGRVIQFLAEADVLSRLKLPLTGADLTGAGLANIPLSGANLSEVNFTGAELVGTNLIGANLQRAELYDADLSFASIYEANLYRAVFTDAILDATDFTEANLNYVVFARAKLINAYFGDADLSNASFYNANLGGASFSDANLSNADLSSAENWTEAQLSEAKLCNTKLPKGCKLDPNRNCEELQKARQN